MKNQKICNQVNLMIYHLVHFQKKKSEKISEKVQKALEHRSRHCSQCRLRSLLSKNIELNIFGTINPKEKIAEAKSQA